ncbi:condensation domain-containing protein [Streptomyces anulatus]
MRAAILECCWEQALGHTNSGDDDAFLLIHGTNSLTAAQVMAPLQRAPRHPADGPLRPTLLRLSDGDWVLAVLLHHLVIDGWSLAFLDQEFSRFYRARRQPDTGAQTSPPPLQLGAYADTQRNTPLNEDDLRHRAERQAGAPDLSTIPSDRPRPAELSTDGARIAFRLYEDVTSAYAGSPGPHAPRRSPFSRPRQTPCCTVTAPVTTSSSAPRIPPRERLRRLRDGLPHRPDAAALRRGHRHVVPGSRPLGARSEVLDLVRHRDVPFGELVRRTATAGQLGRFPLFQTVVQVNDSPESGLNLPGATAERLYAHSGTAKFDLCSDLAAENEAFRGFLDYATDLYDPATARRIADRYRTLLASVLADPDRPLAEAPLLSSDEYEVVTRTWACAARPADPPPVQAAFEAQRRRTPHAPEALWHDR